VVGGWDSEAVTKQQQKEQQEWERVGWAGRLMAGDALQAEVGGKAGH